MTYKRKREDTTVVAGVKAVMIGIIRGGHEAETGEMGIGEDITVGKGSIAQKRTRETGKSISIKSLPEREVTQEESEKDLPHPKTAMIGSTKSITRKISEKRANVHLRKKKSSKCRRDLLKLVCSLL